MQMEIQWPAKKYFQNANGGSWDRKVTQTEVACNVQAFVGLQVPLRQEMYPSGGQGIEQSHTCEFFVR